MMKIKRGNFRKGAWTDSDQGWLIKLVTAAGLVRAFDYATGDDPTMRVTKVAEAAMPLGIWAILLLIGASLLIVGFKFKCHVSVFSGHTLLGLIYSSFALGVIFSFAPIALDFMQMGIHHTPFLPWYPEYKPLAVWDIDGIRHAGPLAAIGYIHLITAYRMGYVPLEPGEGKPLETITGDVDG